MVQEGGLAQPASEYNCCAGRNLPAARSWPLRIICMISIPARRVGACVDGPRMQEKNEKADGRVDCDHVSGLPTRCHDRWPRWDPRSRPKHGCGFVSRCTQKGSLDPRFDRSSSFGSFTPASTRGSGVPRRCRSPVTRVVVPRPSPDETPVIATTARPDGDDRASVHLPARHQRPCSPGHLVGKCHSQPQPRLCAACARGTAGATRRSTTQHSTLPLSPSASGAQIA